MVNTQGSCEEHGPVEWPAGSRAEDRREGKIVIKKTKRCPPPHPYKKAAEKTNKCYVSGDASQASEGISLFSSKKRFSDSRKVELNSVSGCLINWVWLLNSRLNLSICSSCGFLKTVGEELLVHAGSEDDSLKQSKCFNSKAGRLTFTYGCFLRGPHEIL